MIHIDNEGGDKRWLLNMITHTTKRMVCELVTELSVWINLKRQLNLVFAHTIQ